MKKELSPAGFSTISKLKLISEVDAINEMAPYFQIQHEFADAINVGAITTPLLQQPLDNAFNRGLKRAMDILLSTVIIITVLSWLIPIIALLIKLSSRGPVFFLQKRNKRNGELFTCIKFRSMYKNADADILAARKNDKRITPIGSFLRRHYLDELPQFFNVLWGDMSIIGPRPHMISDNVKFDELIRNYGYRHKVKPGITGLAQVLGYTGPVESLQKMEARVNMDIFYARHWSPKIDIVILYRTICKTLGI
ncbi:MAG TPA: sugar transferase [Ferruginibacter sp.]|jgi:putative colanic acid biosynthesis UDP-glucose lipid carrier transferase|nr:sugar transferase [Ferruginibacter sp.]